MHKVMFLVKKSCEGGYTAKAIGESIFTEAETMDELKENIQEALECHFETPSNTGKFIFVD